ncbi:MAG: hypothetical protein ACOY3P_04480 [Planctomycetota bacterium]
MNLVGKIFTVMILVVSLVLASFAVAVYATHKNWRLAVDNPTASPEHPLGLKQRLEQVQTELQDLEAKREILAGELEKEKAARADVRAKLETEVNRLRDQAQQLEDANQKIEAARTATVTQLETALADLGHVSEERNQLRTSIDQALQDREKHQTQVVRLTEQVHQLNLELTRLKSLNDTLAADFARAQKVLQHFDLSKDMDISGTPPVVEGVVIATPGNGVVEISIGEDDGLQRGHRLEVYRSNGNTTNYVGRIEIVRTYPERSVARILPEFQKANVLEGDLVASKL